MVKAEKEVSNPEIRPKIRRRPLRRALGSVGLWGSLAVLSTSALVGAITYKALEELPIHEEPISLLEPPKVGFSCTGRRSPKVFPNGEIRVTLSGKTPDGVPLVVLEVLYLGDLASKQPHVVVWYGETFARVEEDGSGNLSSWHPQSQLEPQISLQDGSLEEVDIYQAKQTFTKQPRLLDTSDLMTPKPILTQKVPSIKC